MLECWSQRGLTDSSGVVDLDKTDSALCEAAGHEALSAIVVSPFFADPIHGFSSFRFFREVENVGGIHLHPEGKVEGVDGSVDILIVFGLRLLSVQLLEEVELF